MPYVVQLDLGAGAARIAELCEALAPDVRTVTRLGDVPHLSLAIYDELDVAACHARLGDFAAATQVLPLPLAALGIFAGANNVLYVAPVVTEALLALHHQFHRDFAPLGAVCHPHYRPGTWVPHVTLALDLTGDQLNEVVATVTQLWSPQAADLAALRLIRYHPVETLFLQELRRA